jgi:hypothetical protein
MEAFNLTRCCWWRMGLMKGLNAETCISTTIEEGKLPHAQKHISRFQNVLKIKQVLITARLRASKLIFSTLFIAHQLLPVKYPAPI